MTVILDTPKGTKICEGLSLPVTHAPNWMLRAADAGMSRLTSSPRLYPYACLPQRQAWDPFKNIFGDTEEENQNLPLPKYPQGQTDSFFIFIYLFIFKPLYWSIIALQWCDKLTLQTERAGAASFGLWICVCVCSLILSSVGLCLRWIHFCPSPHFTLGSAQHHLSRVSAQPLPVRCKRQE